MAITINVNGLTLCHRGSGGISDNTLPDVCKTPDKGIPLPYRNQASARDLVKGTRSVLADGGHPIAIDGSQFSKSVFDEGGSMGGVVSGTRGAETDWITHSFDVFIERRPACRLTDKLFMNHRNTVNMAGLKQRDLPQPDQEFFDELCEMACECLNTLKGQLAQGETYQQCVKEKIDEKYYDGRYPKPDAKMWREVPFDRPSGWDLIGSKADPAVPTSNYIRPNSRRLDVARLGEDGKVTKLYDMKFGKDTMDPKAGEDYADIAKRQTGSEENFEEFRVEDRCNCSDDWPPQEPQPATVAAPKRMGLLDRFGSALESATGLKLTRAALLAFLLVSEATRVIPLRNAVPVP